MFRNSNGVEKSGRERKKRRDLTNRRGAVGALIARVVFQFLRVESSDAVTGQAPLSGVGATQ
jgi:hypothetical protein